MILFLLHILQKVRSRISGYKQLKNCLEENDSKSDQKIKKDKDSTKSGNHSIEADLEREAIYCAQHSSRRRGLGESEMQEDIGTIREQICNEALRDAGLM